MTQIKIYTRKPTEDYTNSLANSAHFALSDGGEFMSLNKNYGVLFAEGIIDGRNVIIEKGLTNPQVFKVCDKTFAVTARRVEKCGKIDASCGEKVLFWTTEDFIRFKYHGLAEKSGTKLVLPEDEEKNGAGLAAGIPQRVESDNAFARDYDCESASDTVCVSAEIANRVKEHYFPEAPSIPSADREITFRRESRSLPSENKNKILENVLRREYTPAKTYDFPLAVGYADPVVFGWNKKYYFIATNDNTNAVGLFAREADTVEGLFAPDVKEHVILPYNEVKGFIQTFWAPELHEIAGQVYVLFAVGGRRWSPQSFVMKLKNGGSIVNPDDWEEPLRVKKADGTNLTEDGITLDMTYFGEGGRHFVSWSFRKDINAPTDTGSMLYIAEIEAGTPHILKSEPVLLSRPLFGWENIQGTINNEGSFPLITKDKVYLAYSGGAAGGYTYAVGLLSIKKGGDYLDPAAWEKLPCPLLSYYSFPGEYGPGHNSFFQDGEGNTFIAYHAQQKIGRTARCTAIRQVLFRKNGEPFVV